MSPNDVPAGLPIALDRRDRLAVYFFAACVVAIAAAWYLLKELSLLLRPLFMAVVLAYVLRPLHIRLRRQLPSLLATVALAAAAAGLLLGLADVISVNARQLTEQLPRLTHRAQELITDFRRYAEANLPALRRVFGGPHDDTLQQERVNAFLGSVLSHAAGTLGEALVVALYLMFLLMEAGRFPRRVEQNFSDRGAQAILETASAINTSIARYLVAKVKASLLLAAPVTILLLLFDVNFATLWGLLTFLFNFVPYIGSVLGFGLPVLFAFLDLPTPGIAALVAALVLACHLMSASFIEPQLLGRAVGLPPLVILLALTFWGLCWGVGGMLLAVPLTVMLKIIMEHVEATRPIARMLSDSDD